jgi:ABC-type phosphate transport system substrate-binding protein
VKFKQLLIVGIWLATASSAAQARQLALVADRANATANISAVELARILSGRSHTWPDGRTITIVMRNLTSADMQIVLQRVLNLTPIQAHNFALARHEDIVIADTDETVLRFVANTRGAIGVVDLYSLTKDVNVLKLDGKLPVEQGYLLKGN